jgi:hypothetical protein
MKGLRPFYLALAALPAFFLWRAQATGGEAVHGLLIGVLMAGALLLSVKVVLSYLGGRRFNRLCARLVNSDTPPDEKLRLIEQLTAMMAGRAGIRACLGRRGITDGEACLRNLYREVVAGGGDVVIQDSHVALSAICDPAVLDQVLAAEDKAQAAMAAVQRQYDNITLRGHRINLK